MKKIISILIIAFLLLSFCSCKKNEEEQSAASDVLTENAQSTQNNQQDFQKTEAETPEEEKKEHTPAEKTEPEKESLQVQEPENTEQQTKNPIQIDIEQKGINYTHLCIYDNPPIAESIDTSQLETANEQVTATYHCMTPIDSIEPYKQVTATVYVLPEQYQNDPYLYFLAAKPEGEQNVLIFYAYKKTSENSTLYDDFKMHSHVYMNDYENSDNIEKVKLFDLFSSKVSPDITDTAVIKQLFDRMCEFKYIDEKYVIPEDKINEKFYGFHIRFYYKSGRTLTYLFKSDSNRVNENYIADEGFGEYLKSFFEED